MIKLVKLLSVVVVIVAVIEELEKNFVNLEIKETNIISFPRCLHDT